MPIPTGIHQRASRERDRDARHQCERRDVDAVEDGPGYARPAHRWNDRRAERHEDKCRQEDADRRSHGTRHAAQVISDECRGREYRAGRDLTDNDRVQQLGIGQPAKPLDEIGAQKRQQDVAAPEEQRPGLREDQEHWQQRDRTRDADRHRLTS